MKLVGNDIVYLYAKNCINRAEDTRFVNKVLHPSEIRFLEKTPYKNLYLWLFWSVKEAAYKCAKRACPDFKFSPAKIFVENIHTRALHIDIKTNKFAGATNHKKVIIQNTPTYQVNTPSGIFYGQTFFYQDFVYTNVCGNATDFNQLKWSIKSINNNTRQSQSSGIREFFISDYLQASNHLHAPNAEIRKKQHSYPELFINEKKQPLSLSFTHDDIYIAYAFLN